MDSKGLQQIDYKIHLLIGYASKGTMGVIFHWPHLPRQEEVQQKIESVREAYAHSCCARRLRSCTPRTIGLSRASRDLHGPSHPR